MAQILGKLTTRYFVYVWIHKATREMKYTGMHKVVSLDDDYVGSGTKLLKVIESMGVDKFLETYEQQIIQWYDTYQECCEGEKYWIDKNKTLDVYGGWNLNLGGDGGWHYVNKNRKKIHPQFTNKTLWSKLMKGARIKSMEIQKENYEKHGEKNAYYYCHTTKGQTERSKLAVKACKTKYPKGIWHGKQHKESTKKKIGLITSIHQSGAGNSQFGSMWITNGKENRKVKKDITIPLGYRKGRVMLMHS